MPVLDTLQGMSNQLPPRLKVALNLAISAVLFVMAVPMLWLGLASGSVGDGMFGLGLLLMAVFNLFT